MQQLSPKLSFSRLEQWPWNICTTLLIISETPTTCLCCWEKRDIITFSAWSPWALMMRDACSDDVSFKGATLKKKLVWTQMSEESNLLWCCSEVMFKGKYQIGVRGRKCQQCVYEYGWAPMPNIKWVYPLVCSPLIIRLISKLHDDNFWGFYSSCDFNDFTN